MAWDNVYIYIYIYVCVCVSLCVCVCVCVCHALCVCEAVPAPVWLGPVPVMGLKDDACVGRAQLVDLSDAVVQATPAYRALAAALEQARRDAVDARTTDADSRSRLDSYLTQRHAFVEEMEACGRASWVAVGPGRRG
jgi:hypothetical protein